MSINWIIVPNIYGVDFKSTFMRLIRKALILQIILISFVMMHLAFTTMHS